MRYNFDEQIDRRGTNCIKWDCLKERYHREDLISMWIADMDFKTPEFFTQELQDRLKGAAIGYGCRPDEWYEAVIRWFKKQYNWSINKNNIGFVSGIVTGLSHALRCFTSPGDKVLIMPPVYFPFKSQILAAGCQVVNSQLKLVEREVKGSIVEDFDIDWADFESKIKGCKAFILCNPHNPGGRVWSDSELKRIADICLANKVLVFSDEIHCDLSFERHTPFALVNSEQALNTITFHAPSKTFNCAGIMASEWIATSETLFTKFSNYLSSGAFDSGHSLAYYPAISLYSERGEEWLEQAKDYIKKNIDFVDNYLKENFVFDGEQKITMIYPQASFLIFLNFRKLRLPQDELVNFVIDDARLALNDGESFGEGGEGFMRLNVGCPLKILQEAMDQLLEAYKKRFLKVCSKN